MSFTIIPSPLDESIGKGKFELESTVSLIIIVPIFTLLIVVPCGKTIPPSLLDDMEDFPMYNVLSFKYSPLIGYSSEPIFISLPATGRRSPPKYITFDDDG